MGLSEDKIFNSPLEFSLRILFILGKTNKKFDLQRLVYYNYLLLHSSDVEGGPESIHPNLPNRSCEILITRKLIKEGLKILLSKELIEPYYEKRGIYYKKNKNTNLILEHFETNYSQQLSNVATWLSENFDKMGDKDLSKFISQNLNKWGGEFTTKILGNENE
jgi:hypothetical protein